jgi:hypothetical protein
MTWMNRRRWKNGDKRRGNGEKRSGGSPEGSGEGHCAWRLFPSSPAGPSDLRSTVAGDKVPRWRCISNGSSAKVAPRDSAGQGNGIIGDGPEDRENYRSAQYTPGRCETTNMVLSAVRQSEFPFWIKGRLWAFLEEVPGLRSGSLIKMIASSSSPRNRRPMLSTSSVRLRNTPSSFSRMSRLDRA